MATDLISTEQRSRQVVESEIDLLPFSQPEDKYDNYNENKDNKTNEVV